MATSSGVSIPSSEPNATNRISAAATMPISSVSAGAGWLTDLIA